jgi:hypothetical protein
VGGMWVACGLCHLDSGAGCVIGWALLSWHLWHRCWHCYIQVP